MLQQQQQQQQSKEIGMNQEMILKAAAEEAMRLPQQQQQQQVNPHPVPMSIQMATTQDTQGNKFVVLVVQHPVGQTVLHFDPETAERVAEGLKDSARIARTGLEIAR
jgi:hypothetical protein